MIDNAMVVLHLALFSYLVSVTIAWVLIHLIGEKSGVPHALKAEVIIYPIIFSILKGLLPGMLVAALLSNGFGVSGPISMVPVAGGAVVSGFIIHRNLRSTVTHKTESDLLVGAIFFVFLVGIVLSVKGVSA